MIPRRDARRRQQVRRREEPARRRPRFRPDPARRRASPFASARRSRVPLIFTDVFPARPSSRPLELANQARRNLFASPPRVVSRRAAFEPPSRSSLRSRVAVRSAARGRRRRHRSRRATPSRRRRRRRRRRRSHRASSRRLAHPYPRLRARSSVVRPRRALRRAHGRRVAVSRRRARAPRWRRAPEIETVRHTRTENETRLRITHGRRDKVGRSSRARAHTAPRPRRRARRER